MRKRWYGLHHHQNQISRTSRSRFHARKTGLKNGEECVSQRASKSNSRVIRRRVSKSNSRAETVDNSRGFKAAKFNFMWMMKVAQIALANQLVMY